MGGYVLYRGAVCLVLCRQGDELALVNLDDDSILWASTDECEEY